MLKNAFCSSPWFHIKINPQGYYKPCRWDFDVNPTNYHISEYSLKDFLNSDLMNDFRMQLLDGNISSVCKSCLYEEQQNKVSGRQKQLLKSGIILDNFDKTFCSSSHYQSFEYSFNNQGKTITDPVDLQIDLGNTCNSACIMCNPIYSSRLEKDYDTLHQVDSDIFPKYNIEKNWTNDKLLIKKLVKELSEIPNIKYIHFLGGETLYIPAFYQICEELIKLGLSKEITIGTTTNLTFYDKRIEYIIENFKKVDLGLSIESFESINDYVRWPSSINTVQQHLEKFLKLRKNTNLHLELRITPNILTIYHLDTLFKFMIENSITAESCNILQDPKCLRIELLPKDLADQIISKLNKLKDNYSIKKLDKTIINRRRNDLTLPVIGELLEEYLNFLNNYTPPDDLEEQRFNLVRFLKHFESLRENSIINHLPEYEKFLRQYNY